MPKLYLYNSLSRKVERFKSINPPNASMYTCGPTTYDYPTIGNWRTYVLSDLVNRVLQFNGYKTKSVMNLTDVGHLSGDNLGDSSVGEDRLEKASRKEKLSMWDVSKKYSDDFLGGLKKMNILSPDVLPKATDHIKEQIELIKKIENKGLTYKTDDGIYFDVAEYGRRGFKYGELSTLDQLMGEGRVAINPSKRDPRDFALWKFFATGQRRHDMEWQSPWGEGFPGWHIECSAMSAKYLGEQFDIHIGGEDLRSTHHPNEIAQSEAAFGKRPFVRFWIHGAFLLVDGGRMGKSLGNAYTLQDIEKKGFDPMDLRYFYFASHYRNPLNFTWEALAAARTSYRRLVSITRIIPIRDNPDPGQSRSGIIPKYDGSFLDNVNDDLNMPKALALVWKLIRDKGVSQASKVSLILKWDGVLGLRLGKSLPAQAGETSTKPQIPNDVSILVHKREGLRRQEKFDEADKVRGEIERLGFEVRDGEGKTEIIER